MKNKEPEFIGIYDNCFNEFVFNAIPANSICLDVGCWNGNLGAELIKRKNCIVDGIDFNEEVLNIAKKRGYSNVYRINFNNDEYNLPNFKYNYDVIIFADILEHLINPVEVIQKIKKYLKINGIMIISIPNIAFILYRLKLLFAIWDYNENGGVMDKSHLRFFTKKTILDLINKVGLKVLKFQSYNLVSSKYFYLKFLGKIFPGLFSLQFLIQLKNE